MSKATNVSIATGIVATTVACIWPGVVAGSKSEPEGSNQPAVVIAKRVTVFVLTGQSNSLGTTADPAEKDISPGENPLDAGIAFFWRNRSTRTGDGSAVLYGDSDGRICSLKAQQGEGANRLFWGPEIGFGRRLAEAGVTNILKTFHTQSTERVRPMFAKYLGYDVTEGWSWNHCTPARARTQLNRLAKKRGDIAHRSWRPLPGQPMPHAVTRDEMRKHIHFIMH